MWARAAPLALALPCTGEANAAITAADRRMLASCFLGTTIEWYDFIAYAFLAPLIFDRLFFPSLNAAWGNIAVFGAFAAGFAARPVGGLVCGHFGDRIGRKPVMVWTLAVMGACTTAIGLLPTAASIGMAAPLLLVTLRSGQGFALGGESTGGPLLATESAPARKGGLFAALVQSGAAAGTALGALVVAVVTTLPRPELLAWGWRVPFLLSVLIFPVGLYVRLQVAESPLLRPALAAGTAPRVPLVAVWRGYRRAAGIVLLCAMAESSVFYFTSVFGLSYGIAHERLPRAALLGGIIAGNLIGVAANPLFGALSDRVGRRPVIGASFVLAALYVPLGLFPLLATGSPAAAAAAMLVPGALLQPLSLAVDGSFYPELFDNPQLRFSGVCLGRQFGTALGGGLMPVAGALLLRLDGGEPRYAIGWFVLVCAAAALAVIAAPETLHRRARALPTRQET